MKIAGVIKKAQRKKERKRTREKLVQNAITTVIGVPYMKIEKMCLAIQAKRWGKDKEKSKQKVVNEIARYIKKEMEQLYNDEYWIYNAWKSNDLDYGSCLCLHYFPYEAKHNKKFKVFKRIFMDKKGVSEDRYYAYFFEALRTHFEAYEDIDVTTGIEQHWGKKYEYIKLAVKTKEDKK